jgi:hypothetical protein
MTKLGVAITVAMVTIFVAEWLRHRTRPLPAYGWLGLVALAAGEWLLFRGVEPLATYFTPFAWTAYILLADAAVFAVRGRSRLSAAGERREFARIALLSIPLWLIFEAYNLRLENWTYIVLPENWLARYFGYAWSFATITPGIFVTADLIESFGWFIPTREGSPTAEGFKPTKPVKLSPRAQFNFIVAGALMLVVPVVLPQQIGAYLFAPVWLGFIFLLDPINFRLGLPSLLGDLEQGRRVRLGGLLVSGWVCGWLWEFWNYWASAKWLYIFPLFQDYKIFEMPVPGYFGFPPFALECFTMYVFASWALRKVFPWPLTPKP